MGVFNFTKISTKSSNKYFINLGANYTLSSEMSTENDFAYTFRYNYSIQEIAKDTLELNNNSSTLKLPQKIEIGLVIGKAYKNKRRWDLGVQYSMMDWENT